MDFNRNRIRTTSYRMSPYEIAFLTQDWKAFFGKIPAFPSQKYAGKGIVYTAGGMSHVTCLWISINVLRSSGCDLPIEVWYLGNEISADVKTFFKELNVHFRDFQELGPLDRTGVFLKPLAILHSTFKEVLYIDADNVCLRDPTYLFDIPEYKYFGTLFWPDYWITDSTNPIWEITGTPATDEPEQESGQLVVNKETCWKELSLCLHLNVLERHYYKLLYGDKDTFRFAWHALKTPFYRIPFLPGSCGVLNGDTFYGHSMVQHDSEGNNLFLHRNLLKWDITLMDERSWEIIKRFKADAAIKEVILKKLGERRRIDLVGDTEWGTVPEEFRLLEEKCLHYLQTWRSSHTYFAFYEHLHFMKQRYSAIHPFSLKRKEHGTTTDTSNCRQETV